MANEIERRRWNDEQQVASWPKRERFTDRVVPYVVAALNPAPGEKVLDIGSGGGKLSLAIGAAVKPRGKVTGADISAGMVRLATGRAEEANAANVSFTQADVQSEAVPGGPFDAATSQFGVMFFDEPVTAFTNIRKQLKKGGRIAFACWQGPAKNAWFPAPVLAPFMPPAPPPPPGKAPTGPFQLADAKATRKLLSAAGFSDVTRTPRRLIVLAPVDSIVDPQTMVAQGVPGPKQNEALAAMEKHFAQFMRADGLCRFELNFHVFSARNA